MEELVELDRILDYIATNKFTVELHEYNNLPYPYIEYVIRQKEAPVCTLLEPILAKLLRDRYIESYVDWFVDTEGDRDIISYKATFEGILFNASGGYGGILKQKSAESIRVKKLEIHQQRHQSYMTWLTIILSCGTLFQSIYYVCDLKKRDVEVLPINLSVFLLIFVVGVGAGLIVQLLISKLSKQK